MTMDEGPIFIVDDDTAVRDSLQSLLETHGFTVKTFSTAWDLLKALDTEQPGCFLLDVRMPGMNGLELQKELVARRVLAPTIIMTGHGDVSTAVEAMKAGAMDFIEKPGSPGAIVNSVRLALEAASKSQTADELTVKAREAMAGLTSREREILEHLIHGAANKVVARALGISPRTVENHRAHIMLKTGTQNVADLVRLATRAGL